MLYDSEPIVIRLKLMVVYVLLLVTKVYIILQTTRYFYNDSGLIQRHVYTICINKLYVTTPPEASHSPRILAS